MHDAIFFSCPSTLFKFMNAQIFVSFFLIIIFPFSRFDSLPAKTLSGLVLTKSPNGKYSANSLIYIF